MNLKLLAAGIASVLSFGTAKIRNAWRRINYD
jgi:hypothetical protein